MKILTVSEERLNFLKLRGPCGLKKAIIKNGLAKLRLKLQIKQMDNNLRNFNIWLGYSVFGQIFISLQASSSAECENAALVIR